MTDEQRAGQLFMVGVSSTEWNGLALGLDAVRRHDAGGVVLDGTAWRGSGTVAATVRRLQAQASRSNGPGVRLLVSGNQEGGQAGTFQAFYGPGFSVIPAAASQGQLDPGTLRSLAREWGAELAAAGVNLDLAPVLDVVPPGTDAANRPIGAMGRELGHDPAGVAGHGLAVMGGLRAGGVAVAVKHFPGLGRVTGNTDFTAGGTTDTVTGTDDPYLAPFRDAIRAGAEAVLISSATYTRIDPSQQAVFSPAVIAGLLRGRLGFGGVVVSDDVGAAIAVAGVPLGDRAVRFLAAGGDIVLTIHPLDLDAMVPAVLARMRTDAGFRALVSASVRRVLVAKRRLGLVPGCAAGGA